MPEDNQDRKDEVILPAERTERNMDKLFGTTREDDEVDDTPDDEEVIDDEVDDTPDDDVIDEEVNDDEEIDYEKPVTKKKPVKDDDEEIKDETHARRLAKENGRKAKDLELKLKERDLEIERERTEREKAQARLTELEATRVSPTEHPDYVALHNEVFSDANAVARRLPGKAKLLLTAGKNFGTLMSGYIATTEAEGDDLLAADEKLASSIASTLQLSELPYEDLDDAEKKELKPVIDKVIDVLERNLPKTRQLQNLYTKLSERAKTGHLAMSVREYEQTASEFQPVLDAIGDLPDDVIDANPHAVESVVARMIKESPEAAKRFKAAKRDVLEVIVGPRALSQDEIDKLEANGTDVKKFLVDRQKAWRDKQRKLLPLFVQSLVTRATFAETLKELATLRGEKEGEEEEFDALRRTIKKPAPKKVEEKKRDLRPGSAVDKLFGPED